MDILSSLTSRGLRLISKNFRYFKAVFAHCDTLDGPVVSAGRKALQEKNPNFALIWVKPETEPVIRSAYDEVINTLETSVSDQDKLAAEVAFYDKLVSVHREGEGADYEGLKPAGYTDEALKIADRAVESGGFDEVWEHVTDDELRHKISHHFEELKQKSIYDVNDLQAGRDYVHVYAHFIHLVEHSIKGGDTTLHSH